MAVDMARHFTVAGLLRFTLPAMGMLAPPFKMPIMLGVLLREFILSGGFDIK